MLSGLSITFGRGFTISLINKAKKLKIRRKKRILHGHWEIRDFSWSVDNYFTSERCVAKCYVWERFLLSVVWDLVSLVNLGRLNNSSQSSSNKSNLPTLGWIDTAFPRNLLWPQKVHQKSCIWTRYFQGFPYASGRNDVLSVNKTKIRHYWCTTLSYFALVTTKRVATSTSYDPVLFASFLSFFVIVFVFTMMCSMLPNFT